MLAVDHAERTRKDRNTRQIAVIPSGKLQAAHLTSDLSCRPEPGGGPSPVDGASLRDHHHRVMGVEINLSAVPVDFEIDEESGEVTAFNDELRVMAVGSTRDEAESRFRIALERLLYYEFTHERPLPPAIAKHVKLTAGA